MHDWTLRSLEVDWGAGEVRLCVDSPSGQTGVRAIDLYELRVPRAQAWGPSVSINSVDGPSPQEDGRVRVAIEMQSGDLIEIVARSIEMPLSVRNPG
jgi:hypothetical protein